MEKLYLHPELSHFFRDNRGGIDFFLDALYGALSTDLLDISFKSVGCTTCKWGTWFLRNTIGSKFLEPLIVEIVTVGCRFVNPYVGYEGNTCPGIIR